MALINTSLPNLIQGVSQQPDATRFSGQCDDQVNFTSSVVDGLTKRHGTRFVGKLFSTDAALPTDSFIHFINRSKTERYVLIHDGTKLHAYNLLTGLEAEINGSTGGYTVADTYFDISNYEGTARELLRATTVADGTFVVNRAQTVAVDESSRSDDLAKQALIFVKQGDYGKKYALELKHSSTDPVAAEVALTYTRARSIRGTSYIYTLASVSVTSGGLGYNNGQVYAVDGLPSSVIVAGVTYDNLRLLTVDPTFTVTSNASGAISALSIKDAGTAFGTTIDDGNAIGATMTLNVDLVLGEAIDAASPTTKEVFIYSENSGESFHSNTSRITEILVKGTGGSLAALDVDTYNHHGSGGIDAEESEGFVDVYPNILAGTNTDFTLEREGNLIVLTRAGNRGDFEIKATDGLADGGLGVVYKEVGAITDLPLFAKNGFVAKVRGDADLSADDYYVKFETDGGQDIGNGKWIETFAPSQYTAYNTATLPHLITNDAPDSFVIEAIKTTPRLVGDDDTNPLASFTGEQIQNSVFFKNRLGFVFKGNVVLSEAGLGGRNDEGAFEYNFGRTTVTTLLDSDPIDVTVEAQRVVNISAAAASQENLVLFSDNGQFVLKGEDLLTPKTVSVKPVTNFEYNNETDPVSVGSYIYYPFDLGQHTGIREFSLNKTTDVYDSVEITEQVPRYVPKNILAFEGSLSENMLAVLSEDDPNCLYIYRYFYNGDRKVLSAWFKWEFDVVIKGFSFMESTMYIVATDASADESYILKMPLNFDGEDEEDVDYSFFIDKSLRGSEYQTFTPVENTVNLDMRIPGIIWDGQVFFPSSWYAGTKRPDRRSISEFGLGNLPYPSYAEENPTPKVYSPKGDIIPSSYFLYSSDFIVEVGDIVLGQNPTGYNNGDAVWVGYEFDSSYTFSEQIFKAQQGQARTPNAAAKQFIKNVSLYHTGTAELEVKVTPDKRDEHANKLEAEYTGTGDDKQVVMKDGFFRSPVFTSSEGVTIKLENNSGHPCSIQSAEFESFIHTRTSRYGA